MNQASFFCPHCHQQRLFQSTPMNHVAHILASVFLCGLWLPIWIIMALSHQDTWRCSFCGYGNQVKYLQNPRLWEQEQVAAQQQQVINQQRADERQRLLAEMPTDTASEKMGYYWAAHKIPILLVGGGVLFIGFMVVSNVVATRRSNPAPAVQSMKRSDATPIFNAAALAGKSAKEVEKILGKPIDSWTPRSGASNLMQSYALGEEMTVEFSGNSIESLVIFFSQKNVDTDTAHRLVGLDYSKPKPAGISNVTTGGDWIKVFYAKMASSSPSTSPTTMRPALTPVQSRKATIISENANLRSTTDTYGEILFVVPFGEEVDVVKQKGPWFQVKYLNQTGWVHGNTIRLVP